MNFQLYANNIKQKKYIQNEKKLKLHQDITSPSTACTFKTLRHKMGI